MKLLRWSTLTILTFNVISSLHAQQVEVRARFQQDSLAIGEWVPFTLTAKYPSSQQVLFPDSTFSFLPFELRKKKFFPTRTKGDYSYDSAVYFLTTFEIDRVQRLQLPVFVLQARDCVAIQSQADSILLSYRVKKVPDSVAVEKLPLKTNTAYQRVSWLFNYPLYGILGFILIVLLIAAWLIFGKSVRRYFTLRRLSREYESFVQEFNRSVETISAGFSSKKAEEATVMWKRYMERLYQQPFTKFTSREINALAGHPGLSQALREIDKGIYGGIPSGVDSFRALGSYTAEQFQKRQTEIRNG